MNRTIYRIIYRTIWTIIFRLLWNFINFFKIWVDWSENSGFNLTFRLQKWGWPNANHLIFLIASDFQSLFRIKDFQKKNQKLLVRFITYFYGASGRKIARNLIEAWQMPVKLTGSIRLRNWDSKRLIKTLSKWKIYKSFLTRY